MTFELKAFLGYVCFLVPFAYSQTVSTDQMSYLQTQESCRKAFKARNALLAEQACSDALQKANALPPERQLERADAARMMGNLRFARGRFPEAKQFYEQELSFVKQAPRHSVEEAYAVRDLAAVSSALKDRAKAVEYYESALAKFKSLVEETHTEPLRSVYSNQLSAIQREYAALKIERPI